MATLTNTKVKDTYDSLLKVNDNNDLTATLKEITDGIGNGSGISLNTQGDLSMTGDLTTQGDVTTEGNTSMTGNLTLDNDTDSGFMSELKIKTDSAAYDENITGRMELEAHGLKGAFQIDAYKEDDANTNDNIYTKITVNDSDFIGCEYIRFDSTIIQRVRLYKDVELPLATQEFKISGASSKFETRNGIYFGQNFNSANLLDDYEEGTFSPTLINDANQQSVTYTIQSGYYTKVGNQVTAWGTIQVNSFNYWPNKIVMIGNLPFVVANGTYALGDIQCRSSRWSTSSYDLANVKLHNYSLNQNKFYIKNHPNSNLAPTFMYAPSINLAGLDLLFTVTYQTN